MNKFKNKIIIIRTSGCWRYRLGFGEILFVNLINANYLNYFVNTICKKKIFSFANLLHYCLNNRNCANKCENNMLIHLIQYFDITINKVNNEKRVNYNEIYLNQLRNYLINFAYYLTKQFTCTTINCIQLYVLFIRV